MMTALSGAHNGERQNGLEMTHASRNSDIQV